jgi:hypothetical protein
MSESENTNSLAPVDRLSYLIDRAAATLIGAKTHADILDVFDQVNIAYSAAKAAERLFKARGAHDVIIGSCQKAVGDILIIESQAKQRLAQEYTAAQERGEVRKQGQYGERRANIPAENVCSDTNVSPTVAEIGLTPKQVHEARLVDAAEKLQPGIVQKTVEEKIQAGEFPTRADITRAVKNVTAARVVEGLKSGKPRATVAKETGITERQVRRVAEQNNLGGRGTSEPAVDPATLSQTAQQKLNTAIKQHIRKLEEEFAKRVQQEVERRIGDLIGEYKDKYAMYQRIIMNRKGHMEESAYKNTRFGINKSVSEGFHRF